MAYPGRSLQFKAIGDLSGSWDGPRLRQVLSNLVGNAIEHGDQRSAVEVIARSDDSLTKVTIKNQGPVIAASALPTLFDPFVRATWLSRSNERGAGIGLGLFIARQVVIAHGGTITVASSESTGTVFKVSLLRHHGTEARTPTRGD